MPNRGGSDSEDPGKGGCGKKKRSRGNAAGGIVELDRWKGGGGEGGEGGNSNDTPGIPIFGKEITRNEKQGRKYRLKKKGGPPHNRDQGLSIGIRFREGKEGGGGRGNLLGEGGIRKTRENKLDPRRKRSSAKKKKTWGKKTGLGGLKNKKEDNQVANLEKNEGKKKKNTSPREYVPTGK